MELIRNFAPVVLGISLLALSGCNDPKYSRVWVLQSSLSSPTVKVMEAGMTREVCELSVLNAGRSSQFRGSLTEHSECPTDAKAVELVAAMEVRQAEAKKAGEIAKKAEQVAPVVPPPVTLAEEAAASQRRTDALLKRTEDLVRPSADPRLK
jgi:hypothetical protein